MGDRQEDQVLWACVRSLVWTLICDRPSIIISILFVLKIN